MAEAAPIIDLSVSSKEEPGRITPEPYVGQVDDSNPATPGSTKKSRRARKKEATTQEEDAVRNMKRKSPGSASEIPPNNRRRTSIDGVLDQKQPHDEQTPSSSTQDDVFFVDVEPLPIASHPPTQSELEAEPKDENKLLLPAHVTVFGSTPVEIIAPTTSLEDDSIQFLDYDDAKEFVRYYEDAAPKIPSRVVCKRCGVENQHRTSECTVIICLTCGVRDDHSTRSCPISKVCFNCGMKGHIIAKCPNRYSKGSGIPSSRFLDCERCYSTLHKTNECPTWWRMYLYQSDEGKAKVMSFREEKSNLKLGEGGEGYVANDEWCYNCGNCGHWGDDCPEPVRHDRPQEPSAFSDHNVASGPFYDPSKDGESSSKKPMPRERRKETFLELEHVPDDVGRMGKEKAKSRLGKMMLKDRVSADDDPEDWFSRARNNNKPSDNGKRSSTPTKPKGKSFSFSESFRDRRPFQPAAGSSGEPPSLLSRLGDTYQKPSSNQKDRLYQRGESNPSSSSSKSKRQKDRRERQRSPEMALDDYRSRGKESGRRRDYDDRARDRRSGRQDRFYSGHSGGGTSNGSRYRGSYHRD